MVSNDVFSRKLAVVGSACCGKSALVNRAITNTFSNDYITTLGAELSIKNDINAKRSCIDIWCCSGQERYKPLISQFIEQASGVLICFDMMDLNSFVETKFWLQEVKRITPDAFIALCGTKSDEVDGIVIKPQDAQKQAAEWNVEFRTTSAKTGSNVNDLFDLLSNKMK